MPDFEAILFAVQADERYQANLDWGTPRSGHAEGTVRCHIGELEKNLHRLRRRLTVEEQARLWVIIHTHDTFKADAKRGVPITDPRSHASLARQFLSEFCGDADVLNTVQYHDEPYALWNGWRQTSRVKENRLNRLIETIDDWDLFLAFQIVDNCTESKDREPLRWFFDIIADRVKSKFTAADIFE